MVRESDLPVGVSGNGLEAALAESEARLRFALQSARMVAWDWDLVSGGVIRSENAHGLLCPYEHRLADFFDKIHPEDRPAVEAAIARALAGEALYDEEFRIFAADGELRWVRDRAQVTFGLDGQPLRMAGVCVDVTEHKKATQALQAGERRFRALIEKSFDGVGLLDCNGGLQYVSPGVARILGYSADELIERNIFEFTHPADQADVTSALAQLREALGASVTIECRVCHQAGEWRWIECTATNLLADPSVYGIVGNIRDVTERKQTEEALQAADERLRRQNAVLVELASGNVHDQSNLTEVVRTITESAAHTLEVDRVSFWLLSQEERVLRCADLYERPSHTHSGGAELRGGEYPAYFAALEHERIIAATDAHTDPSTCEFSQGYLAPLGIGSMLDAPVRLGDRVMGVICHEHVGAARHWTLDEQNFAHSIADFIAIAMEASERKRAEEALRRSEERKRFALEAARAGIWELELPGGAVRWSDRLHAIHGLEPGEFGGTHAAFLELVHPEDREQVTSAISLAIEQSTACDVEFRTVWPDGSVRWVEGRCQLFRDKSGRPDRVVGIGMDGTERKLAEVKLREFTAQLEQSNRELQDFAYVASHDLQEPLRKIETFADRLRTKHGSGLGEEGCDYLVRMQNAATRMRTLVHDLLAFSRVTTQARPFVAVDLDAVARDVLIDLETLLERTGGSVQLENLPTIDADPTQMRQLLQNLIGNALKFRREGTPPTVRVWSEALTSERKSGSTRMAGCRLFVADNGIGFEEKYLDRIFNPFQRLHGRGEYEGTGIGLAICRKIAERHGGSITATSDPGQGATFIVTLPSKQSGSETRNERAAETGHAAGG
jgi:PAS domain S-box-containing protein